jgi:hypothetical protein
MANFIKNNPIEASYLCRMGIIRELHLSYREVIWMEKNIPFELIFYQHFLSNESKEIRKQREKITRKMNRR